MKWVLPVGWGARLQGGVCPGVGNSRSRNKGVGALSHSGERPAGLEHRALGWRTVIRQSGWREDLGFGLSSIPLSLGWFYHLLGPWVPC